MEILDNCLELRRRIVQIEERIEENSYNIRFPKVQAFSDVPKGKSSINSIERYIIKQDKLEQEKSKFEKDLSKQWKIVKKMLTECNADEATVHLLYLRFNRGYQWRHCTAIMKKIVNENWNENKTYVVYRKTLKKLEKYNKINK